MWWAANSLSCAERSPIMTAAPGSISSDQRLSIVRSCGKHKAVRSQNRSIIDLVRFIYQSPPDWHGPLMGLSGWVSSHIIRTIEYWDNERRRYPAYEHIAVLVAEQVTARFLNVIGL